MRFSAGSRFHAELPWFLRARTRKEVDPGNDSVVTTAASCVARLFQPVSAQTRPDIAAFQSFFCPAIPPKIQLSNHYACSNSPTDSGEHPHILPFQGRDLASCPARRDNNRHFGRPTPLFDLALCVRKCARATARMKCVRRKSFAGVPRRIHDANKSRSEMLCLPRLPPKLRAPTASRPGPAAASIAERIAPRTASRFTPSITIS